MLKNQNRVLHSSNKSVSFNRFQLQEILAAKEDPLCPRPSFPQLSSPALHHPQSSCVQPRALSRAGDIQKTIEVLSIHPQSACVQPRALSRDIQKTLRNDLNQLSSLLLLTRMLLLDSLHHPQIDCI